MTTAIFPGTFDPFTFGHQNIVERALRLCDRLIIAVGQQSAKSTLMSLETRLDILKKYLEQHTDIVVMPLSGLLVDFATRHQANLIIRGVRGAIDTDYEIQLANMNHSMTPKIDTIFLPAQPQWLHVSSTWVREIAKTNPSQLSHFIPQTFIDNLGK